MDTITFYDRSKDLPLPVLVVVVAIALAALAAAWWVVPEMWHERHPLIVLVGVFTLGLCAATGYSVQQAVVSASARSADPRLEGSLARQVEQSYGLPAGDVTVVKNQVAIRSLDKVCQLERTDSDAALFQGFVVCGSGEILKKSR